MLVSEFQWSLVEAGGLVTLMQVSGALGRIAWSLLADRVGRVRVTWWAVLTFTLCTGIIGFSRTYWEVAVMRFISGFGIAALYSMGVATMLAVGFSSYRFIYFQF